MTEAQERVKEKDNILSVRLDTAYFVENWKLKTENNKKITVRALVTVHIPDCIIHVPWTVQ